MALIKNTNKIGITGLKITAGHKTFSEKLYMNFRPVVQVAGQHVLSCILHCHIYCIKCSDYKYLMSDNSLICPSKLHICQEFCPSILNFLS